MFLISVEAIAMKETKSKFKMNIIRKAIKDQHWTMAALAKKIGISRQGLYYYLAHPTIGNIWTLAFYLKLDIKDLIK